MSSGPMDGDPYFYQHSVPPTGVMDNKQLPSGLGGSGIMDTVSSVVESGYNNARRVVFGDQSSSAAASSVGGSLSLFSLSYKQIVNFLICFCVGCLFMFLAFLFLPMVVIAPQKFVMLFTLGCLSWIAGLGTLQGGSALLAAMIQRERLPFSIGYVASLVGTIYATMVAHSYILTILFAGLQLCALGAFIISYFPGGIKVLSVMKNVVVDKIMSLFGKAPQTILPI